MRKPPLSIYIDNLYRKSIEHRNIHKCGGYPFEHGSFLNAIAKQTSPAQILEIGTAIGYSTICLAQNTGANVLTIDLNEQHKKLSEKNFTTYGVCSQTQILIGNSVDILPTLSSNFDIIFFDGFAPNPDEVEHFARLIGLDGILISTNHSWNESTTRFFEEVENIGLKYNLKIDTAFSSRNTDKLEMCEVLWESHSNLCM